MPGGDGETNTGRVSTRSIEIKGSPGPSYVASEAGARSTEKKVTKWKRASLGLKAFLGLSISVVILFSVVVPIFVASRSGVSSVNSVLRPLADTLCGTIFVKTTAFLQSASTMTFISTDWAALNSTSETGNSTSEMPNFSTIQQWLFDLTARLDPFHTCRYVYWASVEGEMTCLSYDEIVGKVYRQEVLLNTDGTFTNQMEWLLDETGENASYPYNYTDMGVYEVFEWLPEYLDSGSWADSTSLEVTSYNLTECIITFWAPVFIGDVYMGVFGADVVIGHVSDFLNAVSEISSDSVAFICDNNGLVLASSEPCSSSGDITSNLTQISNCDDPTISRIVAKLNLSYPLEFHETEQRELPSGGVMSSPVYASIYPLDQSLYPNWSMFVALSGEEFTADLQANTTRTIAISLSTLCIAVGFLMVITFVIINRVANVSVEMHSALEIPGHLDLDSGAEKILSSLNQIMEQTSDLYSKSRLQGVISQMITGINNGNFFSPNLQKGNLDVATQEWLRVEYGQQKPTKPSNVLTLAPSSSGPICALDRSTLLTPTEFDEWSFLLFDSSERETVLPICAMAATRRYADELGLSLETLYRFFKSVSRKYRDVPFHSAFHAADVVQAVNCFLLWFADSLHFTSIDCFSMLVAAVIHDVDHPGLNNNFQILAQTSMAKLYNDQTPLEHHHAHIGLSLLAHSGVISVLDCSTVKRIRDTVISLVLSTDMGQHWKILSEFNTLRQHGSIDTDSSADQRLLLMKIILKMADVSNVARPVEMMKVWIQKLTEEFFYQGDMEKQNGLPVTSFMDRCQSSTRTVAQTQTNFIRIIAQPLFEGFNGYLPIPQLLHNIQLNYKYWSSFVDSHESSHMSVKTPTPKSNHSPL
ncbi:cAMP phosphodiesterase [Pelomyxa schiedti]|nr:cAMP phosphodiesterase [Pelomyxa schiedti]